MVKTEQIRLTSEIDIDFQEIQPARPDVIPTDLGALAVARVETKLDESGQIVFAQPWSGHVGDGRNDRARVRKSGGRQDVLELLAYLSSQTQQSVVSTDTFGMGELSDRPTRGQLKQVRNGNFDQVTAAQWQAIGPLDDAPLTILGYSLGASLAASQANTFPEANKTIDRYISMEGVVEAVSLPVLIGRFGLEAAVWSHYFAQNPDWMAKRGAHQLIPGCALPHIKPYIDYPRGISKGTIFNDLSSARERETIRPDTEIIIASGELSRVSPVDANYRLAERIQCELGMSSVRHTVLLGESHGLLDSGPKVVDAIKRCIE